MVPSEALVETLVAEGVKTVFGIVGSAFMDALDLFPDAGIRFVSVAHEQAACHAADGLARVTGRPQCCIAQNGPGAANFVSALTAAYWAHSPVVAITPETGSLGIGTGGFQEIDQMPMFQAQTVYQVRVNRAERMAELARRAFYMAKVEHGPTQLNIPRDYFYGVCEDEIYPTLDVTLGAGPRRALEEAAKLLAAAKYPVILAGGGVSQGDAVAETKALADHLTAPVVNSYLHNDTFPADDPMAVGPIGYCGSQAAMHTIAKADVVLALGSRLGPFGTLPQYDIDYWPAQADEAKVKWQAELAKWSGSDRELMHPRRFLEELAKAMPRDAIVATDIGNNCSMANSYFTFGGPRQHIAALSWGNCGFAMGAAMGAKMGAPDRPVFCYQGDGAWGIGGLIEVMTVAREKIPVIAIVANNHEWGAEKKNQIDYYDNRFVGTNLRQNPSFAQIAEDMGAKGYRVTEADQVGDIVREAMALGEPCVIEGVIEGGEQVLAEPFRRDALKPALRYLDKYKNLNVE
jgi:sulfoacetaldehyde acetyltransferase